MKKNYGKNDSKLLSDFEVAEGIIETDDENDVMEFEREIFKGLLKLNITVKNLNMMMASNQRQVEMCKSSIKNSEKALSKIDSIKNAEIFYHFYNQLQQDYGKYLATILAVTSGTFADDRIYEDDKYMTKQKNAK